MGLQPGYTGQQPGYMGLQPIIVRLRGAKLLVRMRVRLKVRVEGEGEGRLRCAELLHPGCQLGVRRALLRLGRQLRHGTLEQRVHLSACQVGWVHARRPGGCAHAGPVSGTPTRTAAAAPPRAGVGRAAARAQG
eukprot:scaffold122832_cov36-Phaeocystis_antarctica.AAC.1